MTITKMNKLRPQQMFLITYMNLDSPLSKVFVFVQTRRTPCFAC